MRSDLSHKGEVAHSHEFELRRTKETHLRILAARSARVVQEFSALKQDEGVGNAGRPMHPQSRVQKSKKHTR